MSDCGNPVKYLHTLSVIVGTISVKYPHTLRVTVGAQSAKYLDRLCDERNPVGPVSTYVVSD